MDMGDEVTSTGVQNNTPLQKPKATPFSTSASVKSRHSANTLFSLCYPLRYGMKNILKIFLDNRL
jgi:hypothetical protein